MLDPATRHFQVVDRFFGDAPALRKELDRRLSDRTDPQDPARFVWEYWHVPAQYSQQRAPARAVFSPPLIERFERRLLDWSAKNLGLSALGDPPWLSYLVDGQFQSLHRDSPNGQFAFSYGLTKPERPRFRGGQTLLARPELLDYWRRGGARADTATTPLFDEVEPRFNRLVVFDARVPHAVRMVEGPRLPREGRVAIQGWLEARGCVPLDGAAGAGEATRSAARALARTHARDLRDVAGLASFRVDFARAGIVRRVTPLADVLVATGPDAHPERAARTIAAALGGWRFGAAKGAIVVPVLVAGGRARVADRGA